MARRNAWSAAEVAALLAVFASIGCSNGRDDEGGGEAMARTRQSLTQTVQLPVPAGLSPQDIVIGATNIVNVNDTAHVRTTLLPPQAFSTWGNVAAFGLASGTTNLGVNIQIGVVWSRPRLLLRGGTLEFYEAQNEVVEQMGQRYRRPQENRTGPALAMDSVWRVDITAPEMGQGHNVNTGATLSLPNGNYGDVVVNSNGTLVLTGSGDYGFRSLTINSASTVQLTASVAPRIFIRFGPLNIRSALAKPGLILGYLGANTANIEIGGFQGDLLLAPNAGVEIKANSIGHFFARDVTVFEGVQVQGEALSSRAWNYVLPTERATTLGEIAPNALGGEISGTVLTPSLAPSCGSSPVAFVSHQAASLYRASIGASTFLNGVALPVLAPANSGVVPPFCIGDQLPLYPDQPHLDSSFAYANNPVGGTPYYTRSSGTDNVTARVPNGVVELGFSTRSCRDLVPTNPPSCPQGPVFPSKDSACAPAAFPALCFSIDPVTFSNPAAITYDAVDIAARCLASVTPSAPGPSIEVSGTGTANGSITIRTAGEVGTATFDWGYAGQSATGVTTALNVPLGTTGATALMPRGTYTAGTTYTWGPNGRWVYRRHRVEAGMVSLHKSTDCGATWTAKPIDYFGLGLAPGTLRLSDRPDMYVDPHEDRIFVTSPASPIFGGFTGGRSVILVGTPKSATDANSMTFSQYCPDTQCNDPTFIWPIKVATVLEERARLPNGSTGRRVHVVRAGCVGVNVVVDVQTPFGWRTITVNPINQPEFECRIPDPAAPIRNRNNIDVVGISSVPPRVRVVYNAVRSDNTQIAHSFAFTLFSANGYSQAGLQASVVHEHTFPTFSVGAGMHTLLPNLIAPDGLAGSSTQSDMTHVLRTLRIRSATTIDEQFSVIYPGLTRAPSLVRNPPVLDTITLSDFNGNGMTCPNPSNPDTCFLGDYRYGSFLEKSGLALRFFTPWPGPVSGRGGGAYTLGGIVHVEP